MQDTVLFNDTILANVRYGKNDAADAEVFNAADMASIHTDITTRFPQVSWCLLLGTRESSGPFWWLYLCLFQLHVVAVIETRFPK